MTKLKSLSQLLPILNQRRKARQKIVFTNGCFDLLHVGHVRYLNQAKTLGDVLVLGLNGDVSVRKLKGSGRPVVGQKERAEVLSALEAVDFVVVFNEATPERLIRALRPDVLVKGGDWKKEKIVGAAFVESCGGKVFSLPFIQGRSTSRLLKKIKKIV